MVTRHALELLHWVDLKISFIKKYKSTFKEAACEGHCQHANRACLSSHYMQIYRYTHHKTCNNKMIYY